MNTNHAPGPWEYEVDAHGRGRIKCGDAWLATTWTTTTHGDNASPYPAEANARLIAAAPELFEACQQLLDYVEITLAHDSSMSVNQIMQALKQVKSHTAELETYHHPGCPITTRRVDLNAARAAIAKAKVQ